MKIALTADVHLTSIDKHPERFNALEDILDQLLKEGITKLVVAGDLFDEALPNYKEFDAICNKKKFNKLQIHCILGNHDPDLSNKQIVSDIVTIYQKTQIFQPDLSGHPFLMVPYQEGKSMGEAIEDFAAELPPRGWILIGHGNYSGGLKDPNAYETSVYMPLSTRDIDRYKPREVFLGHSRTRWGFFGWAVVPDLTTFLMMTVPSELIVAKLIWMAGLGILAGKS